MKKIVQFIFAFSAFCMLSCEDLLNTNDDPSRISSGEATIQTLLPSAIRFTSTAVYGSAQFGVQYPQYLVGQSIAQYTPYGFDQLWAPLYNDALPTLQEIIKRAEPSGAFNYSSVAKTLLALNMLNATSIYGGVPYTQANQGTANLNPCYDTMEDLYQIHIIKLLDDAIDDLRKPLSSQPSLRTIQNDYIYGGDTIKWRKAARAIRARYYLHLSNRTPSLLPKAAEEAQKAFTSNADDLQLAYEELNPSPWFTLGNAANKTLQPSSYIVNLLNGTGYFLGVNDPRLPIYMTISGTNPNYVGLTPGEPIGPTQPANVNATIANWHFRAVAPIQFITYAEVQFIVAEALFDTNRTASYQAYLNGIEASMLKVGVPAATISTFLSNAEIGVGSANLTLADILLQKYIALYLQIEAWTDMRRYQYDPAVFVGIQKPLNNQIPGNPWIQRSNIADSEPGVNTCLPPKFDQGVPLWLFE
jgi:hypothetical protein